MQKNWRQKAKIRLLVGSQHVEEWSLEKETALRELILREFHLTEGDPWVQIKVSGREKIAVEFTVVCYDASVSAMRVAEALEQQFLDLKIHKREISFEDNGSGLSL